MAIKETEAWVKFTGKTVKYYEDKGYEFPTYIDKLNKVRYKKDGLILVKIEDLTKGSNIRFTKICDICKCEVPNQVYNSILTQRKKVDGLDRCFDCGTIIRAERRGIANESNCVATTHPEFAKLFWNQEETKIRTYGSDQRTDFKCPQCGSKIVNKRIADIHRYGLGCLCSDGISYPQKFINCFLSQLKVKFEKEKVFDWAVDVKHTNSKLTGMKKYDFYLNEFNIIVESHGMQHYEEAHGYFGAKTLEEEQENDRLKKSLALENGFNKKNYISIDCRYSKMEFIKENIKKSFLNSIFDLDTIDWLKCHEYACNSLVKETCDLWVKRKDIHEISDLLKITTATVRNYLKQGKLIGLCEYDPKEEKSKRGKEQGEKNKKPIIQLTLNGEFVREWESIRVAERVLGLNNSCITATCRGKLKSYSGFLWMYKEDFSLTKVLDRVNLKKDFKKRKPVIQLSLKGEFIHEWESLKEAENKTGINRSAIGSVCKGKESCKTAGGYVWMYKDDYEKSEVISIKPRRKPVIQLSLNGEFIREWESTHEIKNVLGIWSSGICSACTGKQKTASGFKWMYKEDFEKLSQIS